MSIFELREYIESRNRKVLVYKNNIFISEYNSIVECSKSLKIPGSSIANQAMGRSKQCYGYTFKFGEIIKIKQKVEK